MQAKVEKKDKTTSKLVITIDASEMAGYFKQAYEKLAPEVKIDGFRAGKAPRKLIEASVGVNRILSEALDLAINDSYFKAIVENKINTISAPNIVINKYPNYGQTAEEVGEPLEYEAEVEFLPEVKLGDYSKVKVEKGEPGKASDEDYEKVLDHFKKQASIFNEKDGPAEKGDQIEINFEGSLKKVRMDQMCSKNHPLILGDNTLIPGFEDNLIGMKKGDKKEFKIKFPKDYHSKDFADQEAKFKVEMVVVKSIELPKIDDKFAEKFGHKNIKDLEKAIKENLNEEYKHEYRHQLETKVLDKVLPLLSAEIPQSLVEKELDRMISDYAQQLQKQGIDFERYISSTKKTKEDLRKEMAPHAERNIKVGLLLGKIIEEQKFDHNNPESAQKAIDYLIEKVTK